MLSALLTHGNTFLPNPHKTNTFTDFKFNESRWYHVGITWNKELKTTKIYADGEEVGSHTGYTSTPGLSSGALVIGQEQDSVGGGFDSE